MQKRHAAGIRPAGIHPGRIRPAGIRLASILAALAAIQPVGAADLSGPAAAGRFLATCEDLGRFCFADACGRD